MKWFVTGTDTGVGKTYVAVELVREARRRGLDAVGWKPLCCGERTDAELLAGASGGAVTLNQVNPVWFRTPAAPYTAAIIEDRPADLDLVRDSLASLCAAHDTVIAEGAGGWEVPIRVDYRFSDLAVEMGWPVLVVAANRLGALNHALLTVRAIQARGLTCLGVCLNHPAAGDPGEVAIATNHGVLETLLQVPVWELAFGGSLAACPWWRLQ
jgi:dethiobiotin synthetase